ncbi:MAG TPA: exonuclease domain-containing protein [Terriglobia bacterium]|nr:exonuclease domain-containing protein [Terriglobia bacterium]
MPLIFYDTETTGTEIFFDQILQFAAIQTDETLTETDRFAIRSRLLPHLVPAPGAVRVTGVTVAELSNPLSPSHYEMVRLIHEKLLSWSPALFIGWNSIEFDEDLVRLALYMTLHNPYLTGRHGNSRSDAMRMAQACSIFCPGVLTFPTDEKGRNIFKLQQVALANGLKNPKAHDAVADAETSIQICRLILDRAPDVWSSFMRFSSKASVVSFITEEPVFCLSDCFFGQPFSWICTVIGQSQDNSADWYVFNLEVDPATLRRLSATALAVRLKQQPKPVRKIKSNSAPMLCPSEDAPEVCKGRAIRARELERRAALLQADAEFRQRLIAAFESLREEYPVSLHVEEQIYDAFVKEEDEELMESFHKAEWPVRLVIVEKFQDLRLRTIGKQLIHLERPDLLDKSTRRGYRIAAARRLLGQGEDISWLTLPKAIDELQQMIATTSGAESKVLREHLQYLRARHKQALLHIKG